MTMLAGTSFACIKFIQIQIQKYRKIKKPYDKVKR
jgi:hypothetical protein